MANKDNNNNKVKGLLKGLRYISQIFDEKEPEMKIGNPTDVKHVAHIGWDGPSVNSGPSWMNEFQGPTGNQSGPLTGNGDMDKENAAKCSDDANQKHTRAKSSSSDMPELPKAARRQSSSLQSEKSDKPKQRKSSKTKDGAEGGKTTRKPKDPSQGAGDSDVPKKSRPKKPKDKDSSLASGGSTRSRNRSKSSDQSDDTLSKANNNSELCQMSGVNPFEDG